MKRFPVVFLLCVSAILLNLKEGYCHVQGQQSETELVFAQVIFRHGERTTEHLYPNDPNINNTWFPAGLGGLTNRGKLGEFALGKFLRAEYDQLLGPHYFDYYLEARSTDTTRTIQSCLLALAGLFPPSEAQTWNPELDWQPIPVFNRKKAEEDLFHPEECAKKLAIIADYPKSPEVQKIYIEPYEKLFKYVEENSGMPIKSVHNLQTFYFIIKTEHDLNMTIPDWVHSIYPEPLYSASRLAYDYLNFDEEVRKVNTGYLGKKIMGELVRKAEDPEYRMRVLLYSGHESTVAFAMQFLKVFQPHIPSYGAALLVELHKDSQQHFYVKIRYRNEAKENKTVDLAVPGCDSLCPLDKFVELYKDSLPTLSVDEACKIVI